MKLENYILLHKHFGDFFNVNLCGGLKKVVFT